LQEKVEDIHMMEEAEAVMDAIQTEDRVLLSMKDHFPAALMIDHLMKDTLHVVLMGGHQTEDHLPVVLKEDLLMEDHQAEEAVLQEQEPADHLQPATAEAAMADPIAHHQKEEVVHQAADVDVKKVVLLTDKFSPHYAN
jgi:hypothetical protein